MIEERLVRYQLCARSRKALVADWREAEEEKRSRDMRQRHQEMAEPGALLHEQCDKYKRCNQV